MTPAEPLTRLLLAVTIAAPEIGSSNSPGSAERCAALADISPDRREVFALHVRSLDGPPLGADYAAAARAADAAGGPGAWCQDHAYRALEAVYGQRTWWGLGGNITPDECLAVLARHLIGQFDFWTWRDYSRATLAYRLTVGPLHPADPEVADLAHGSPVTAAEWSAAVERDATRLRSADAR